MEIHASHHPVLTLKDGLIQLGLITVGILIALSLEGALERSHNRALVTEARHNLQSEIRNNQADVQVILKGLDATLPRFLRAIEVVGNLSAPENAKEAAELFQLSGERSLLSSYAAGSLNTASRTTAEISGAFAFMDYDEIRKYAEIYDAQALFSRAQDGALRDAMAAVMFGLGALTKAAPSEVEDTKRQLRLALAGLITMRATANALNQRYSQALKGTS